MKNMISKGFHRVGILLAILVFIFSLLFSTTDTQGFSLFDIIVSLIIALFVYSITRLVGWVIKGFMKDN